MGLRSGATQESCLCVAACPGLVLFLDQPPIPGAPCSLLMSSWEITGLILRG